MDYITFKREVAAVLQDVPNHSLPLFKFREMFERRYRRSVSTSDLYRMRDVVTIMENSNTAGLGGRKIALSEEWVVQGNDGLDVFCRAHPPSLHAGFSTSRLGWAEKEIGVNLPHVEIDFRTLSTQLATILKSHHGGFPLFSFLDCYGAQFGSLERLEDGTGVPLEHLIASVHGVEIIYDANGMKRVQWKKKGEFEPGTLPSYDPLSLPLAQLSRELVDLLKTMPRCSILFSKLIPAYHHHFGRQLRVADYGHMTLSSLMQILPNTIQVLGEGSSRIITLAHKAQMKRFASDAFRVLKNQNGVRKQIPVDDFQEAFAMTFPMRHFCPEDYGLCFYTDLVHELVENFSMVTLVCGEKGEEMLSIPKREQTMYEQQKMQIFAAEVVELLGHSIRCEMQFSKFIPSYHHHYGKQCRVSDYGFTKLAELFEAISETVVCENPNFSTDSNPEDKILRLTPREQVKVVGNQIREVVEKRLSNGLLTKIDDLEDGFLLQHGFTLRVDLCGATDLRDLVTRLLYAWVRMDGEVIRLVPEGEKRIRMTGEELIASYATTATGSAVLLEIESKLAQFTLGNKVTTTTDFDERVKCLQAFGDEMRVLLEESGGSLGIQNIEQAYSKKYGRTLNPAQFGCHSLMHLLNLIPEVATLRGKFRTRRILVLNKVCSGNGENRNHSNSSGNYRGKITASIIGSSNRNQDQGRVDWKTQNHCSGAPLQQQTVAPPLFSPIVPSHVFRQRDSNIFNFEQPTALSSPVYDMWVGDNVPQGTTPPASPSIVWAYHPFCYPPPPGSPNLFIPSFSYAAPPPWNSTPPGPSIMSPPQFELDAQPLAQASAQ